MPIYEYECGACGERHEFIQKISEAPKRKCPSCGKSKLKKLISAAAFHLKGEGWYVTDFRDKDKKKRKANGEGKGEDKKESETKEPAAGKESKSENGKDSAKSGGKSSSASSGTTSGD